MSWLIHHNRSQELAVQAEFAREHGEEERASTLYREAAEAEEQALADLDPEKARTLGITAVSAVSLWYKGREFERAQQTACRWLGTKRIPPFAEEQLKALLQSIWGEIARSGSGVRFTGAEVLVSIAGGEVVHGGAPLDLIFRKIGEIGAMFYRTTEFLMVLPHRKHGPPSTDVQKCYRPWLLQAPAGSYQFAVRLEEPRQGELFKARGSIPQGSEISSKFFDIVRASAEDPEGALPAIVRDPEYRSTFVKMTRNLAPTRDDDFGKMEIRSPSAPEIKSVFLVPAIRETINRTIRRWTPKPPKEERERSVRMTGVLRALHLDEDWIEITVSKKDKEEQHIRIDGAGDQVDDVLGPMVNRPVMVDAVVVARKKNPYRLRDIQPWK